MHRYEYKSYDEYKEAQTVANKRKINNIFAKREYIERLCGYIKSNFPHYKFGICHGTRNGAEQKWFREILGIEVIGTEISDTATQFPHTIQWDFHEVKEEWIKSVDFIYSNSWDHSYDPDKSLNAWMSCLSEDGICIIEWTTSHSGNGAQDPFGANRKEYTAMISRLYDIKKIVETTSPTQTCFFIISNRKA